MKRGIALLLLLALASCVNLTPEGERVVLTGDKSYVSGCTPLGVVTTKGGGGTDLSTMKTGVSDSDDAMLIDLRNKVAEKGGNAAYFEGFKWNFFVGTRGTAEAYRCPGRSD